MKPTPEIRYVIRTIKNPNRQDPFIVSVDLTGKPVYKPQETIDIQVLQQKWATYHKTRFEWRDVPFVKGTDDSITNSNERTS
jgi:hypothetical protein